MKHAVQQIAVLGAGSWGTAMAISLAHQGHDVLLWARDPAQARHMQSSRKNQKYLGDIAFPKTLQISHQLTDTLHYSNQLIAVPSHAFEQILTQVPAFPHGVAWLTKGLEPKTHALLSDVVQQHYGSIPMAMIAGPSFAKEVAMQKPTALIVAAQEPSYAKHWQSVLHTSSNRVYLSADLLGLQICGSIKNVLAIACGISDGLDYGANSRAALITRGLAEMQALGQAMGAEAATFHGLAGLGDLVLTCTDNQSRNRRFGMLIGQGYTTAQACQHIQQVVEGLDNVKQVHELAQQYQIDMPISTAVYQILHHNLDAAKAAQQLLNRPLQT